LVLILFQDDSILENERCLSHDLRKKEEAENEQKFLILAIEPYAREKEERAEIVCLWKVLCSANREN